MDPLLPVCVQAVHRQEHADVSRKGCPVTSFQMPRWCSGWNVTRWKEPCPRSQKTQAWSPIYPPGAPFRCSGRHHSVPPCLSLICTPSSCWWGGGGLGSFQYLRLVLKERQEGKKLCCLRNNVAITHPDVQQESLFFLGKLHICILVIPLWGRKFSALKESCLLIQDSKKVWQASTAL